MPIRKRNLSRRQALDSNAQAWLRGEPCGFFKYKSQEELQKVWDEFGDHENMFWESRYCLPAKRENTTADGPSGFQGSSPWTAASLRFALSVSQS